MLLSWLPVFLALANMGQAYIPAHASDVLDPDAILPLDGSASGQSASQLTLASGPHPPYDSKKLISLTYLAKSEQSRGVAQGALSVFSEHDTPGVLAQAPWVALISCDRNETLVQDPKDVVHIVGELGAAAVIFYSNQSSTCVLETSYRNTTPTPPIDIYTLNSNSSFSFNDYTSAMENYAASFPSDAYNGSLIASLTDDISIAIGTGSPIHNSFLLASIRPWNSTAHAGATAPDPNDVTSSGGAESGNGTSQGRRSHGVPMTILYAVTGVVSFLFILIIVSGAIRAIRHPERYGPRSGQSQATQGGGAPQSRTQGLSRAILDTFAVVRFRAPVADPEAASTSDREDDDDLAKKSRSLSVDKTGWELVELKRLGGGSQDETRASGERIAVVFDPAPSTPVTRTPPAEPTSSALASSAPPASTSIAGPSALQPLARPRPRAPSSSRTPDPPVLPSAIGTATCPICIADFAENDELRILPCEGQHQFHSSCVDPWLLELSSSCPLCRQDFAALESMLAGERGEMGELGAHMGSPGGMENHEQGSSGASRASHGGRFSRYIRLARRRTRERRRAEGRGSFAPPVPRTPTGGSPERDRRTSSDAAHEANVRRYAEDPTDPYMPVLHVGH